VIHVLWECSAARDVWGDSDRCFQKSTIDCNSFLQLAETMMARCGTDEIISFVRIARKLWHRRNEWIHEKKICASILHRTGGAKSYGGVQATP
jgi:hypothetical protein